MFWIPLRYFWLPYDVFPYDVLGCRPEDTVGSPRGGDALGWMRIPKKTPIGLHRDVLGYLMMFWTPLRCFGLPWRYPEDTQRGDALGWRRIPKKTPFLLFYDVLGSPFKSLRCFGDTLGSPGGDAQGWRIPKKTPFLLLLLLLPHIT